jgi:hypothetical protein
MESTLHSPGQGHQRSFCLQINVTGYSIQHKKIKDKRDRIIPGLERADDPLPAAWFRLLGGM